MKKTTTYNIQVVEPGLSYQLNRMCNYDKAEFSKTEYAVNISANDAYRCSCSKFSRDGLHCCHILRVAVYNGLTSLPESFVNPRWTIAARHEVARMTERKDGSNSKRVHLSVRYSIAMSKISNMLSNVCTDDRSYNMFMARIADVEKSIILDKQLQK
jgi:hypothetical protein